jgi:hypothetical protein
MNARTDNAHQSSIATRFFCWLFSWRTTRRVLIAFACLATLIALFYAEENWRGKRAWELCKRELEAKGAVLDWNAYIPPPVPDDQNFFKAPGINESDWVGRGSRELNKRLSPVWPSSTNPMLVAELTIVPPRPAREAESVETLLPLEEPATQAQVEQLVRSALGPSVAGVRGSYLLVARPLNQMKPAAIVVPSDKMPTAQEILRVFPATIEGGHLQIKPAGTNSFRVLLDPPVVAASDYLRVSDPFEADFDNVRNALIRPCTRIDGDYSQPYAMPIPNFITMRIVTQVLAERTKCYLLLGQPEKALTDLTLLHDICRILEAKPTGKPMTLVAAMINVAITGLYVNTIADGMRLQAWREPQLAALQHQLEQIDLLPFVAEAFREERVATTHTLEKISPAEISNQFIAIEGGSTNLWRRLKDPLYTFLTFAPRGWVYQNLVVHAQTLQPVIDSCDPANTLVHPAKAQDASERIRALGKRSPNTFLESMFRPNFTKATQTMARNQTLANEAQIACALERHRLAHGQYPETLDALVPQFIAKLPHDLIGGQPLHYRRTAEGEFLLYSIGWNERDDGGQIALNKDGREDLENGDWVWPAK